MKNFLLMVSATALIALPATAQQGQRAGLSEACRTEVKALCGAAEGRDARKACMKENRSKLSESCQAELKARKQARKAAKAAQAKPAN
jgi:arylformamidase